MRILTAARSLVYVHAAVIPLTPCPLTSPDRAGQPAPARPTAAAFPPVFPRTDACLCSLARATVAVGWLVGGLQTDPLSRGPLSHRQTQRVAARWLRRAPALEV